MVGKTDITVPYPLPGTPIRQFKVDVDLSTLTVGLGQTISRCIRDKRNVCRPLRPLWPVENAVFGSGFAHVSN